MMNDLTMDEKSIDRLTRVIFDHAARVSRAGNMAELIRLNADFARDLVGANRCSLWLIDEKSSELWTIVAHGIETIRIPSGHGLVGACVRDGEVLLSDDVRNDPRFLSAIDVLSGYQTRQVLCIPMRSENGVIGAVQLLNKEGGFTPADVSLVGLLAHFAASAIESDRMRHQAEEARLFQHELELASVVQARLLPQETEAVGGITAITFCRPARTIGGDYCDLINLGEGRLAFTLGDVSGKGIAAAVMMASIQILLRSLLQQMKDDLAQVVVELNRALYASSTENRYSTLFCGVIDTTSGELTYVNAGHLSPLLRRADGQLMTLEGGGLPIGLLSASFYELRSVALKSGDSLLVVSDGITEACNLAGEFWDDTRIAEILQQHASLPIETLPAVICAEVDAWASGAEQFDDMTIVALHFSS